MFTRYSGIDIPHNYSGNRFRKADSDNLDMKIHKNHTQGAIKSSISPSFEKELSNFTEQNAEAELNSNLGDAALVSIDEQAEIENSDTVDVSDSNSSTTPSINDFLKSISSDDLLIIALILFLATDKNVENNDIIILLALLLAYHA